MRSFDGEAPSKKDYTTLKLLVSINLGFTIIGLVGMAFIYVG